MSTAATSARPAAASAEMAHWVVPLAVLIAGMFMSVLDTSIVNVAVSTRTGRWREPRWLRF